MGTQGKKLGIDSGFFKGLKSEVLDDLLETSEIFADFRIVLVKQMDGTWLTQEGNFGAGPPPRRQHLLGLMVANQESLRYSATVAEDNALEDPVAIEKQLRSEEERAAKRQRLAQANVAMRSRLKRVLRTLEVTIDESSGFTVG